MSALWTCIIPRYINQLEKHEKTNFIKEVEVYASPLAAACGIELWIWTALDTLRLPDISKSGYLDSATHSYTLLHERTTSLSCSHFTPKAICAASLPLFSLFDASHVLCASCD